MKNCFLVLIIVSLPILIYGQEKELYVNPVEQDVPPALYVGTGTGMNNLNAFLGFFLEGNIIQNFTLAGGFGIGAWGYKAAVAARYYRKYPYKVFYGLGFSTASGISNIELEVYTEPNNETEFVEFRMKRANTLNLSLGYQFKAGKKGRIYLELGYGIRLQPDRYEILTPNVQLTETSTQVMDMMVPGGLILGVGYSFGFH
jgi:hypothetical protein